MHAFKKRKEYVALSLVAVVFICQVIGIVLNVQGGNKTHWAVIFIPLWILEGAFLGFIIYVIYQIVVRKNTSWTVRFVILIIMTFAASLVFLILLSIQLSHPGKYKAISLYSPVLALLIFFALYPYFTDVFHRCFSKKGTSYNPV